MSTDKHQDIFKDWFARHKGLIYRIVRAYTATAPDADDLFQDILTQLWISVPSFKGNAKSSTWIYRVALNTAMIWQRGQKKIKRTKLSLFEIDQVTDIKNQDQDTHSDQQVIEQLYDSIRQLPKIDASLILLHLDGLTYREIADILGITENNVGVKLNRAKKQLTKLMKGLIDDI